jgi:hippurate hydrolase
MFERMDIGLLTKWRRDLHKIPELGFDLFKTHAYVKEALEEMGSSSYYLAYAKSCVII